YTFPAKDDVEVDTQALILVQFTRAVAPLTALSQRQSLPILSFNPPVTGTGKWLTSALYTFRPNPALQAGTTYSAEVETPLSDLRGADLAAPYDFSFNTVAPAVADVAPRDNTKYLDPTTPVRVLFNQAVDHGSAQGAFSLSTQSGAIAGSFDWPNDQTL